MQRSALLAVLFTLIGLFSIALASPLPVQGIQETREAVVELSVREVPADHEILLREAIPNAESGLHVLAREHKTFEEYVNEITGGKNTARDTEDIEPRICRFKLCQ